MDRPCPHPPEDAARVDAWLDAARRRVAPGLAFHEIRRAVQAISSLYVERRASAGLSAKSTESVGKRAAFATYYAPLHLLIARHAAGRLPGPARSAVQRIHDLGCGTAAAGVGFALGCSGNATVLGIDRSGWSLAEARHTLAAFGLPGRTRRASLPEALPRLRPGDAIVAGWSANELETPARARLLDFLLEAARRHHTILVLEPLARGIAPWWPTFASSLAPEGVQDLEIRFETPLPEWVAKLDEASGLDHSELRARALLGPWTAPAARGRDEPPRVCQAGHGDSAPGEGPGGSDGHG